MKELIYSRSVVNPLKALLIADMDDVPFEYYDTVYDLIDRFINNKLTIKEIKTLTSKNKKSGVMELLHDQVRIVFKHVRDNIYCMLGFPFFFPVPIFNIYKGCVCFLETLALYNQTEEGTGKVD